MRRARKFDYLIMAAAVDVFRAAQRHLKAEPHEATEFIATSEILNDAGTFILHGASMVQFEHIPDEIKQVLAELATHRAPTKTAKTLH